MSDLFVPEARITAGTLSPEEASALALLVSDPLKVQQLWTLPESDRLEIFKVLMANGWEHGAALRTLRLKRLPAEAGTRGGPPIETSQESGGGGLPLPLLVGGALLVKFLFFK